jgi:hypothetical protein
MMPFISQGQDLFFPQKKGLLKGSDSSGSMKKENNESE